MGWMVNRADGDFLLLITSLGDLILKNRTYLVITVFVTLCYDNYTPWTPAVALTAMWL